MKCDRKLLFETVKELDRMFGRQNMKILEMAKMSTKGNLFFVEATDLETKVLAVIPCEGDDEKGGALDTVCVPMKVLKAILEPESGDSDPLVEISNIGNVVLVSCGGARSKIEGLDPQDFPADSDLSIYSETPILELLCHDWNDRHLKYVLKASSDDPTRYNLHAVCFMRLEGQKIVNAFCSDGHRMHYSEMDGNMKDEGEILVKSSVMESILRLRKIGNGSTLKMYDERKVDAGSDNKRYLFTVGNFRIETMLSKGLRFPNVLSIIPNEPPTSICNAKRSDVMKAIKKSVKIMNGQTEKTVTLDLLEENIMIVTPKCEDGYVINIEVPVVIAKNAPTKLNIEPKYLEEAIFDEEFTMEFHADPKSVGPVVFSSDVTHALVMPKRE